MHHFSIYKDLPGLDEPFRCFLILEFNKAVAVALPLLFDAVGMLHRAVALQLEVELVVGGGAGDLLEEDLLPLLQLL